MRLTAQQSKRSTIRRLLAPMDSPIGVLVVGTRSLGKPTARSMPGIGLDAPEIRHHRLDHVDDLAHLRQKIACVDVVEGQAVPMRAQQIHQGKAVLAAAEVEGSAPVAIERRHQKNANAEAARVTAGPMYWPAPSPPPPLVLNPCWVPLPSVWPPGNMLW